MTVQDADLAAENARLRADLEATREARAHAERTRDEALAREAAREQERDAALEQLAATAGVLRLISSAPTKLEPVLF